MHFVLKFLVKLRSSFSLLIKLIKRRQYWVLKLFEFSVKPTYLLEYLRLLSETLENVGEKNENCIEMMNESSVEVVVAEEAEDLPLSM